MPAAPLSGVEIAAVAVFGVLALGAGGALVYDAVRSIRFRRRAESTFERVDATIVDAAVHEPAAGGPEAVPHVEYEYAVDGETYTSRSLWPTRAPSPDAVERGLARRVVEDHPAGAEVIARYDPDAPERAYLLAEFDRTGERLELAAGAVLVCVVLLVVVALALSA